MPPPIGLKPGHNKLAGLDHLRALAIIMIMIFHYRLFGHPDWVISAGSFGWSGVDLFFVLSGYLIASQLFSKIAREKNISVNEFYFKRFLRIIPAYLVVVAIYFTFPPYREKGPLSPLWKFLTFTQNFGLDRNQYGSFSHAWSLCVEEQFYLFFPLIIVGFLYFKQWKKAYWLILILFLLGFVTRTISWYKFAAPAIDTDNFSNEWLMWVYYPTYNRLDGLLAGVSIAAIFQFRPKLKQWMVEHGNIMLITGLVLFTAAYFACINFMSLNTSIWGFPLVAIAYGVLVASSVSPTSILYKFNSIITSKIAALSYSLYLTHKGMMYFTQQQLIKLGIKDNSNLMFILCIISCILVALALHYAVEKPFMRLRENILQKRKANATSYAITT